MANRKQMEKPLPLFGGKGSDGIRGIDKLYH